MLNIYLKVTIKKNLFPKLWFKEKFKKFVIKTCVWGAPTHADIIEF